MTARHHVASHQAHSSAGYTLDHLPGWSQSRWEASQREEAMVREVRQAAVAEELEEAAGGRMGARLAASMVED